MTDPAALSSQPDDDSVPVDAVARAIGDALPAAVFVTEGDRLLFANHEAERTWGAVPGPIDPVLLDRVREAASQPDDVDAVWVRHAAAAGADGLTSYIHLADGQLLRWRSRPGGSATPPRTVHVLEDVTPVPRSPARSVRDQDLFRLTFEKTAVGMLIATPEAAILRANASFGALVGVPERELEGRSLGSFLAPEETDGLERWRSALELGRDAFHTDHRLSRSDSAAPLWAHFSVSVVRDGEGRPICLVALAEDVTREKEAEAERDRRTRELQELAALDPLTGLHNQRSMAQILEQRMTAARRSRLPLSAIMLDIDEFREFNTRHGHDTGDRVLRAVADSLRACLREGDAACRYGGDEFVVILEGSGLPSALAAAERLRACAAEIAQTAGTRIPVTFSLGVATFPEHASTDASLLKAADLALFEAKAAGRDRVHAYEPGLMQERPGVLEAIRSSLRGAGAPAVRALITGLDLRDRYTGEHSERVEELALELGRRMACPSSEIELLALASPILDVGKVGLPDELMTRSGRLSPHEWDLMRQHPVWGEQLVAGTTLPQGIGRLIRWHHERLDGTGYPDGLRGEEIPLAVRILSVADVAAALTASRPHRPAWAPDKVTEYLLRHAGTKFDARVVQAYLAYRDAGRS